MIQTLLKAQQNQQIDLEVHVLEESRPPLNDPLFSKCDLPVIRWYGGRRWQFALGLLTAGPDLMLMDHVGLARLSGLLPAMFNRPYALLIHGVEIWNNHRKDYHRSAKKASLLIANSAYTANKSRSHYPDLPTIKVCWPGKDAVHSVHHGKSPTKVNPGPHALLMVGRLSAAQRHKGHDEMIAALPLVLKELPTAQLIVAGDGDDLERLKSRAAQINVLESVVFTGWVDENQLSFLYQRCAVFVMPSDGDGFGLVFLEAMMNKLPCVGLKSAAAAEILEDKVSGILVDREEPEVLARQLLSLLVDEQRRKAMGAAGFARYRELFTAQHFSDRFMSIINAQLAA